MAKYKADDLIRYKEQGLTYQQIADLYGVSYDTLVKACVRLGVETDNNRGSRRKEPKKATCINCGKEFITYPSANGKFCCQKCEAEYKKKKKLEEWKEGRHSGTNGYSCSPFVRRYMLEKAEYKCEKCGWGEKNPYTGRVPLQIHHLDGNSLNNKEENLQVLCPNCHSLTENYGSRNKNAPRGKSKYYGKAKE